MTELNHRLRRLLASAGFLAGLAVLLWGLHILTVPYYTAAATWRQYRALEPGTLDVLMVGNSHSYTSIAPFQIWDEQGITAWHVGGSAINMRMKLAYVRQAFSYHRPKVLALELYRLTDTDVVQPQVNYWAYNHMPQGVHRTRSIFDTAPVRQWERYLFPLVGEHQRYSEINPYSVVRNAGITVDPETGGATVLATAPPPKGDQAANLLEGEGGVVEHGARGVDPVFMANVDYVRQVAELCEQNGVELMLWLAPVRDGYRVGDDPLPGVRAILSANYPDIEYLNTNLHHENMGLTDADFRDAGHVYAWGMKETTTFFGRQLVDLFPDVLPREHSAATAKQWDQRAAGWNPPTGLE